MHLDKNKKHFILGQLLKYMKMLGELAKVWTVHFRKVLLSNNINVEAKGST